MFVKDQHIKFIFHPITGIVRDGLNAIHPLKASMVSVPVMSFIKDSIFIQLTGALEQKMKSILWDMASNNYTFRYAFMRDSHGEYSSIDDKNKVYVNLLKELVYNNPYIDFTNFIDRRKLKDDLDQEVSLLFKDSALAYMFEREIAEFLTSISIPTWNQLCVINPGKKLSGSLLLKPDSCGEAIKLWDVYDSAYRYRNMCAHNTKSYQTYTPKFEEIEKIYYTNDNIFWRFYILLLIDRIFISIFAVYHAQLSDQHKL